MIRKIPFIMIFGLLACGALAQEDSTGVSVVSSSDAAEPVTPAPVPAGISESETPEFIFKPTIGLGVGIMNYIGDLSDRTATNNPIINRIGYDLRVTQPMNDYLDFSFYMMLGKIGANERSVDRNLNFESRITTGGVSMSYNFHHFLPEKRVIEPYFSLGVEAMEFLSKTDLLDQFGNPYYYWEDGSIRNLPETPENENIAIRIQRDYEYESDIRALNADGFGDYDERTWGIPIGAGVNMHLGGRFKFRIGSTLHYTFTDFLDGVTDESVGIRQGNSGNDMILFSSFNLNYNLTGDNDIPDFRPGEFEDMQLADDDGDQVPNAVDECPNSPPGMEVDAKGCPLDEDGDGVADYLDQEPGTPTGTPVDSLGVTMTEDQLELIYLEYTDEDGTYARFDESYALTNPEGAKRPKPKYYVQVGDTKQILSESEAAQYLNNPNISTIQNQDGSVSFVLKEGFENLEDALAAGQVEADRGGDPTAIIKTGNGNPRNSSNNGGVRIVPNKNWTTKREIDPRSVSRVDTDPNDQTIFRVQIGAFSRVLSSDIFEDVPDLFVITTDEGLTRYYSGTFTRFQDAANAKIDLVSDGFEGAYVVSFKAGQKISLIEAGATPANDVTPSNTTPAAVDPSKIKFKVQLGSYTAQIPNEVLEQYTALGNIDQRRGNDGQTKYLSGTFDTYQEAAEFKQQLIDQGFDGAFVVGEFNGGLIPAKEAVELLK